MGYIEETKQVKKKIKVLPCVKCGGEKIDIGDCGYSSFNVAWGKCLDCGNEIQISPCGCDITKAAIVKEWNNANNPKILKAKYQKQIAKLQEKIDRLPT